MWNSYMTWNCGVLMMDTSVANSGVWNLYSKKKTPLNIKTRRGKLRVQPAREQKKVLNHFTGEIMIKVSVKIEKTRGQDLRSKFGKF